MFVRAYASRLLLVVHLELKGSRYSGGLARKSIRTIPNRWIGMVSRRRKFSWLTGPVAVESPFEAVLPHVHQALAIDVLARIRLPHGARVLDVGGHDGQFAISLLTVRPDLEIVSLEPNPTRSSILEQNAAMSRAGGIDWRILPIGLDSSSGDREFFFVHGRSGQGRLYADNSTSGMIGKASSSVRSMMVPFVDADGFKAQLDGNQRPFDLIKVGVEGPEGPVLLELAKLGFRYLLVEVGAARSGGVTVQELLESLEAAGAVVDVIASFGEGSGDVFDVLLEARASTTP